MRFFLSRYSVQRCSLSVWWPSRTSGTWTPARAWFRSVWVCPCLWLAWPTTLTVGTPSTLLVTWVPGCSPSPLGGATLRLRKFTSRDWNSFYIVLSDHLYRICCFHFYKKVFFLNIYMSHQLTWIYNEILSATLINDTFKRVSYMYTYTLN